MEDIVTDCKDWTNEKLVEHLIKLEFVAFDKTRNEGGRASCQDDWETFHIMRKSQYLTWTREMLLSFIEDFENATSLGRNLITEKYAWMMETTSPEEFEEIEDKLPPVREENKAIIEQIVGIQVKWMEEFAAEHGNVTMHARYIHTSEDKPWATSFETYLRGELKTYSDETLFLYAKFIIELSKEGKNLTEMTMKHTIDMYGYASFEDIK